MPGEGFFVFFQAERGAAYMRRVTVRAAFPGGHMSAVSAETWNVTRSANAVSGGGGVDGGADS